MMKPALAIAGEFARDGSVVVALCLVVAVTLSVTTQQPLGLQLIYSMGIGLSSWGLIEFGRFVLRRDPETGWPSGVRYALLVLLGVPGGYIVGTAIGDWACGCSTWELASVDPQRFIAYIAITVGVASLSAMWFSSRVYERVYRARLAKVENDAVTARLALLQSQLEPHMLFNTLANLRVLIGLDPPRAQAMLDRLIAYLRATLSASRALTHPLSAEFERTADYLALMALRMGPRLAVQLELPPALASHPVPTLILQPLVENAIKHGLEPKPEGGRLQVSARREGDRLVLEVLDTGLGLGSPVREGFGTTQIRERLQTLFGDAATLSVGVAAASGIGAAASSSGSAAAPSSGSAEAGGATLARIILPWNPAPS